MLSKGYKMVDLQMLRFGSVEVQTQVANAAEATGNTFRVSMIQIGTCFTTLRCTFRNRLYTNSSSVKEYKSKRKRAWNTIKKLERSKILL